MTPQLSNFLHDLVQIVERDEYDEDYRRPSPEKSELMKRLLVDAGETRDLPRGTLYSDSDGSLRIEWIGARELRLVLSATDTPDYIYHEDAGSYAAEFDVTGQTFRGWLDWYSAED